ncbi:MAG: MATE family efflux transporter [Gammaproteobacteria bacterium]|jgi:MATE family multidrug resistance protein|nr:MATE family efflux transporter [Gammaproteobacteria bacterium]
MSRPSLLIAPTKSQLQSIWLLAWPLMLSNLSVPLLGLVDTAIMGHLSHARYLAAVTVGSTIISFAYWAFGFLRMGTVGLTAQAYGAQDEPRQWQMLYLPGLLGALIGTLIIALSPVFIPTAVSYMQAAEEVNLLATTYLSIRIFSAPAVLMTYVAIGWLLGRQDSHGPLLILVLTNISNIVLNLILVLGYKLQVAGVAWGSLMADYIGFAVAAWLVWRQLRPFAKLNISWHQSQVIIGRLLGLNGYLFVRTLILLLVFAFITAQSASMGTQVLAANTLLLQYITLLAYFLDGFAHAAEASCGEKIGRRQVTAFYQSVNATGLFSLLLAIVACLGFYWLHELFFALLTNLPEVLTLAKTYVIWVVWVPIISVWSYLLDGVFIAGAQSKAMLHSAWCGALAMLLIWYTGEPNNDLLWLALLGFFLLRAIVAIGFYLYLRQRQAWW